jgi:hypothetical protein
MASLKKLIRNVQHPHLRMSIYRLSLLLTRVSFRWIVPLIQDVHRWRNSLYKFDSFNELSATYAYTRRDYLKTLVGVVRGRAAVYDKVVNKAESLVWWRHLPGPPPLPPTCRRVLRSYLSGTISGRLGGGGGEEVTFLWDSVPIKSLFLDVFGFETKSWYTAVTKVLN